METDVTPTILTGSNTLCLMQVLFLLVLHFFSENRTKSTKLIASSVISRGREKKNDLCSYCSYFTDVYVQWACINWQLLPPQLDCLEWINPQLQAFVLCFISHLLSCKSIMKSVCACWCSCKARTRRVWGNALSLLLCHTRRALDFSRCRSTAAIELLLKWIYMLCWPFAIKHSSLNRTRHITTNCRKSTESGLTELPWNGFGQTLSSCGFLEGLWGVDTNPTLSNEKQLGEGDESLDSRGSGGIKDLLLFKVWAT